MTKLTGAGLTDGQVALFYGSMCTRVDPSNPPTTATAPMPISQAWPGSFEADLDAVAVWPDGSVYLFKGSQYANHDPNTGQAFEGYPKEIADGWPDTYKGDLDAAVVWPNGKVYLFDGDSYVAFDVAQGTALPGYPLPIADQWPDVFTSDIDASILVGDTAYFVKGNEYLAYGVINEGAPDGPQPLAGSWLDVFAAQTPIDPGTGDGAELSAGRQEMLALIDKWMPTSLSSPQVPNGETKDLLGMAGWTTSKGTEQKKVKDAGGPPATSCGDVLSAMLRLWRSDFVGAFMIRDKNSKNQKPGAKELGYYVDADGSNTPLPGDILVLESGDGSVAHVGILVEASAEEWLTADGGAGLLPDQKAEVTKRTVRFDDNNIAILKSPTDNKEKRLDGWVDLDRLTQTS